MLNGVRYLLQRKVPDTIYLSKNISDQKLVDDWTTSFKNCGYSMYEVLEQRSKNKDVT